MDMLNDQIPNVDVPMNSQLVSTKIHLLDKNCIDEQVALIAIHAIIRVQFAREEEEEEENDQYTISTN